MSMRFFHFAESRRVRLIFRLCILMMIIGGWFSPSLAGDWPQILGPGRNGIAVEETISLKWPGSEPTLLWQKPVGSGVAGVAVLGDLAVVFHRQADREIAIGLHPETGKELWTQSFPATFQARIMPDNGPLCVPTLLETQVILFGAGGHLHCLRSQTGAVLWSVDTHAMFGADEGYFGAGSSPLVVNDLVLVNVGGFRQDAGIVAFRLKDGSVAWQTGAWQASYSAPLLTTVQSEPLAIFSTRLHTVGLEPATGAVRFTHPFGMRGPTVNGATPVVMGEHLFLTASYGIGNVWAKIEPRQLTAVREGLQPLASQYTTPIVHEQWLFGIDGRQDGGPVDLVCCNPATGLDRWREANFGYATLIKAGPHLLILKTDGTLVIASVDTEKFTELRRVELTNLTCRALPALARGRLYVRDERAVKCFDLSGKQ